MEARRRRRLVALILSIVPGWGHVFWGRELRGLLLFTVTAIMGFTALNALVVYQGPGRETLLWVSVALFCLAWCATWTDLFVRTSPRRVEKEDAEMGRLLHEGTVAYLRGSYDVALAAFRRRLRYAPHDPDALFRLGIVHARTGNHRQARRWLRKTVRHDLEEKWAWEVRRELEQLRELGGAHRGRHKSTERGDSKAPA